jgi:hypothetical protein
VTTAPDSRRVTVVVDGVPVEVRPWSRWRDAVAAHDPRASAALAEGRTWLVDACGNPVDPDGAVVEGAAILCRESAQS